MRNRLLVIVALTLVTTPAVAGGMGDPSANMRQKNAICDAQRRGEGPLYPNLCWPDFPPDGPGAKPRGRAR